MNDIINWIALNNSLMIKIGFSAVVLLLVVYVFRFFFMPSISVVENATKAEPATGASEMNIEELAELQAEVDTLKAKLKEVQSATASPSAQATAGAGVEMVTPATPAVDESAGKELKEKIKVLESRLSEYEIIAEEIAEISKLKQENEKLKEQLASTPAVERVEASAPEAAPENSASSVNSSDEEIDALLGAALEAAPNETDIGKVSGEGATEADPALAVDGSVEEPATDVMNVTGDVAPEKPELFILHSEVEVTEEEKELINSFEDYKKV